MNTVNHLSGNQKEDLDYMELDAIIEKEFDNNSENLIMILQAIQNRYNYLPREALLYVSEKMSIPVSKIYSVGTFYSTFSLKPRGKHIISICRGTACHVRGAERISERVGETLHIHEGETTEDKLFTMESVRCIGCCSLGPVVKINEDVYGRISIDEVESILNKYAGE